MIGQDFSNSSFANYKLKINVAFISCFPRSLRFVITRRHDQKNVHQSAYLLTIPNSISRASLFRTKSFYTFFLKKLTVCTPNSKEIIYYEDGRCYCPLLIIREEHNIALKFKDDHLPDNHAKLVKSYKVNLNLPSSPILPENHCSKKLLQLMTREDKVIWDLIETIKTKRPMGIRGSYMKNLQRIST